MDVFVRTAVWFVAIARNFGQNHCYSDKDKEFFREHPDKLVSHAKDIEDQVNEAFNGFFHETDAQHNDRAKWTARMADLIKDERLRAGKTSTPHPSISSFADVEKASHQLGVLAAVVSLLGIQNHSLLDPSIC